MRRTRRVCGPFVRQRAVRRASCKVVKGRRPVDEVGGPRTQQCGDTKHSVKAPSTWRRWELQADKTVACGTQAYALRSQPLPQGSLPCAVPPVHGVMCLEST